jgi:hypothetical protein
VTLTLRQLTHSGQQNQWADISTLRSKGISIVGQVTFRHLSNSRYMPALIYQQITAPTPEEREAALAYQAESGFFHLATQGNYDMRLAEFGAYQRFMSTNQLQLLVRATNSRFELTQNAILYSGHGNGVGTLGALAGNEVQRFRGMRWQYFGFISTSSVREIAEDFVRGRLRQYPVLLEFHLEAGFRLFPMGETGQGHEQEYLLPPNVHYTILEARTVGIGDVNVVHLILVPEATGHSRIRTWAFRLGGYRFDCSIQRLR